MNPELPPSNPNPVERAFETFKRTKYPKGVPQEQEPNLWREFEREIGRERVLEVLKQKDQSQR